MSNHKSYKNESQDARRHDQFHATHPDEKANKNPAKSRQTIDKGSQSRQDKRK